ncbi:MAG: helix-turn-helix domain-containing protein [Roseburia sp.]|nr:helix-turn-helix domain-containing protein [Roseburia sp.]
MDVIENIDFNKVGKRMKQLRNEQGITQEKIAKDLGSTIAFVSNIENNRTKINLRVLMYYSKLCHISIDSLLNAGNPEFNSTEKDTVVDQEISRVLQHYSMDEKIKILNMLKIGKGLEL